MLIRKAHPKDHDAIWAIIEPVIRAGETCALPRDWSRSNALDFWFGAPHQVFVVEIEGEILGSYYLMPNQKGGGDHIANCGYMTAQGASGRGIATAMCQHSLDLATSQGFYAMQFNLVISTNAQAIHIWQKLGFETLARLPKVFRHPSLGLVDALIMYRKL